MSIFFSIKVVTSTKQIFSYEVPNCQNPAHCQGDSGGFWCDWIDPSVPSMSSRPTKSTLFHEGLLAWTPFLPYLHHPSATTPHANKFGELQIGKYLRHSPRCLLFWLSSGQQKSTPELLWLGCYHTSGFHITAWIPLISNLSVMWITNNSIKLNSNN